MSNLSIGHIRLWNTDDADLKDLQGFNGTRMTRIWLIYTDLMEHR
jgi:hypothetical protein